MNRLQYVYRKLINSLFGDVEVFFALPFRWRLRGALAIGFLYVAIVAIVFLTLYPAQLPDHYSSTTLFVGYLFLYFGMMIVILPIFIPVLQQYPGWVSLTAIVCFIISFNIILSPVMESMDAVIHYVFFIGLLAITFGARLYARVIKEVVSEKTRIDTEIKLAQKIQTDLLPVIDMSRERYEAFGKTVNAQEVGGDFFDVIELKDRKVAFCVGDVSGHNIAAGLIMGIVKSAFRTELRYNDNLASIAESLNKTVMEQRSKGMFVSCAAGILDCERETANFINAGHPPILHIQNGRIEEIRPEGAALGLSERIDFTMVSRNYSPGDILICYTDGIIETRNRAAEEFGFSRFTTSVSRLDTGSGSHAIYETLINDVEKFNDGVRSNDDITLLIIKMR
jgi:serine phosphatase RsbU (regulator of sigma subunit)